ncbi:MAG: secretion protein HlyD family protein [Herbinix sp.]|nr:secretion protein HlyD family protein [Herbinix sp.]
MKRILKKISWKKIIIWVVIIIALIVAGSYGIQQLKSQVANNALNPENITTAKVETRDIQNVLTSSGSIEPLNTYEVTTLVEGEIIAANFEEGDEVAEGQVLYQVATDNLDSDIDTTQTSVDRAEKNLTKAEKNYEDAQADYEDAQEDYQEAKENYGDPNIVSTENGIIKSLYVEEGDTVQAGTQIAQIYDNSYMLLVVPFSASEADQVMVGKNAEVIIEATDESLQGKVTKVSNIDEVLSGNRLVNQVTIQVKNPGGLSSSTTATAVIGDVYSSGEGTFSVLTDTILMAEVSGEIGTLSIEEGSKVKEGDVIFTFTDSSIESQLENYRNKLENAQDAVDNAKDNVESVQETIEDAESKLQDVIDTRTDYSVTAPISGIIISKDALVGDNIKSNSANSTLCIIYDLSAVTFEMSVDELDVNKVKVGQEVEVIADAYEDVIYHGVVTNVSLQSSSSQGVTQYPVTVKISEAGDLLPGMNVTGEIIVDKAEQVIAIPSDALMRGDVVYVEDSTVTEAVDEVPVGFREVAVETGITDGDYVEITGGLNGDEMVYVQRISEAVTMMMPGQNFEMQGGAMPAGERPRGNFQSEGRVQTQSSGMYGD